jgi:exopolysaccharide biosynthesis protein
MKKKIVILFSVLLLSGFTIIYSKYFVDYKSDNISVNTISINGKTGMIGVIKINKNHMSYKVVNNNHKSHDFYVNANYFNKKPIGEVKINGATINPKNKNGGFFTTDGKNPNIYFNERPNNVKYSSQTHTIAIKNGIVNSRIFNQHWAKLSLPRLIIGEDENKNIIIIHSHLNGYLTVKQACELAKNMGVYNGLMFDGGASIEVGIKDGNFKYNYQEVDDLSRKINNVPTPSVFIVGDF